MVDGVDRSSATMKKNPISDQYIGETKNQLRDGYGVYHYKNGFFTYEGEWKAGLKHGHGRLAMGDGSYYEGQFINGEMEGHGFRYWHHSGNEYTGQFLLGELHGEGIMKYSSGVEYEGEWFRNKRQGRGALRMPDEGTYVGDFYNNKRHGQGTMTYANGNVYVGNWVMDLRQGHGEQTFPDQSLYQGQWRTDMFNGQGVMMHCSGVLYDGVWLNNRPTIMATKLVITSLEGSVLDLTQGQTFNVCVECRNEDNELVPEQGRLVQISAGYRHLVAKEGSSLFDAIEDVEENPFHTPFGYDVVTFPLTDHITDDLRLEPLPSDLGLDQRSGTNLSSSSAADLDPGETAPSEGACSLTLLDKQVSDMVRTVLNAKGSETCADGTASSPLPPPIIPVRTEQGRAEWTALLLPAPPPLYRPYMIEDEEQGHAAVKKPRSKPKDPKKTPETEERPLKVKNNGDERFARPGEYVIMVEDLTNPPFMDVKLESAYFLIKNFIDKRRNVKQKVPPKEKKKTK